MFPIWKNSEWPLTQVLPSRKPLKAFLKYMMSVYVSSILVTTPYSFTWHMSSLHCLFQTKQKLQNMIFFLFNLKNNSIRPIYIAVPKVCVRVNLTNFLAWGPELNCASVKPGLNLAFRLREQSFSANVDIEVNTFSCLDDCRAYPQKSHYAL